MFNCAQVEAMMGDTALFLGVETNTWKTLAQFDAAAQFAVAHGVDTLIVKVFDGANGNVGSPDEWYGPLGGFNAVLSTIENRGIKVLPYGYMYGNSKGSILADELALVNKYMNAYGWFMGDIEAEWDGHTDWATQFVQVLGNNPNVFIASVLADPQPEQNSGAVFDIMAPAVNAWAPQVYDAFLNTVYAGEFANLKLVCILPTIDLSNEFGTSSNANDPLTYVGNFPASPISIWEYQYAQANTTLLDNIVAVVKQRNNLTALTPTGEVLAIAEADQFQPGKSQFECGYFACAMIRSGAAPGHLPQRTVQQVIDDGEAWYAQYTGSDDISNMAGMELWQLYALIKQMTYDYRPIDLGNNPLTYIRAWVKLGYPVVVAGAETGFYDMGLGDIVPYPWHPSGNHVIDITGVASDGNFIVRDSANVTDLYDPTSLRHGPRKYDAGKLQLISATAVVMPWLPVPPAGFDPTKGSLPSVSTVPTGWHDVVVNGVPQLTNPTTPYIVQSGFRLKVLNYPGGWDASNVPYENEHGANPLTPANPTLGSGVRQLFAKSLLFWVKATNAIVEGQPGQEDAWYIKQLASVQSADKAALDAATAQITALQAQVLALEANGGGIPADLQTAINNALTDVSQIAQVISVANAAVNDAVVQLQQYKK